MYRHYLNFVWKLTLFVLKLCEKNSSVYDFCYGFPGPKTFRDLRETGARSHTNLRPLPPTPNSNPDGEAPSIRVHCFVVKAMHSIKLKLTSEFTLGRNSHKLKLCHDHNYSFKSSVRGHFHCTKNCLCTTPLTYVKGVKGHI